MTIVTKIVKKLMFLMLIGRFQKPGESTIILPEDLWK